MDDLIKFLKDRLDEHEREARAAFSGQADPENGWGETGRAVTPHVGVIHEGVQRAHVVKWNPARALAEVDAKRRIITLYEITADSRNIAADAWTVMKTAVRLLALPDAAHPDYQEAWRP